MLLWCSAINLAVESIGVVVSIIVDLFARDTDAAQGREGFRKVKRGEREKYLEEYQWLLWENEAGGQWLGYGQKRPVGLRLPSGSQRGSAKKKEL